MTSQSTISIVLANWNGARFLDSAIESVLNQSFKDWELIAVDTGSTDSSRAILEKWQLLDQRISSIDLPQRLPYPVAINLGLAKAKGEMIARIESDDLWLPSRLELQRDFLGRSSNCRVGVCGSAALLIDASGRQLGVKQFPVTHNECLRAIWYRNPFCHSSVLMRRAVFESCGGYDETLACVEDLDLWLRIGRHWRFANLAAPLVCYRVWKESITTKNIKTLAWRSHLVRKRAVRDLGYVRSRTAAAYSALTLCASLLPPMFVRRCFDTFLKLFSLMTNHKDGSA